MGTASGLHIIIFDEIDAICKERGTVVRNCVYSKLVDFIITLQIVTLSRVEGQVYMTQW